jgi:hypothetical protein
VELAVKHSTLVLVIGLGGTTACAAILGIRSEAPQHPFEHAQHAAAGVHCLNCHEGIQQAGEKGPLHLPTAAKCISCHEKPHDTRECGDCHGLPYARGGATRAREVLRFDHAAHLTATKADCVRCHADAGSGAAILRPRMAECLSCHGHDEEFEAQDCGSCHVDLETEGTLPEDHIVHGPSFANDHAAAASRSDGICATCHAERTCAGCHAGSMMPVTPDRLGFDMPKAGGLHRAGFLARHGKESANSAGLCSTCHAPEGCAACHARENLAKAAGTTSTEELRNPHPPGWIGPPGSQNAHGPAVWRDPASCETCHGGAGEQLCVGCHQVGAPGGNPHAPGQRPQGNRNGRPCVKCHTGGR